LATKLSHGFAGFARTENLSAAGQNNRWTTYRRRFRVGLVNSAGHQTRSVNVVTSLSGKDTAFYFAGKCAMKD